MEPSGLQSSIHHSPFNHQQLVTVSGQTIEAIDSQRQGLRVQFTKELDRLAHTISVVCGEQVVPLLRSCEGTDQQEFPPSPPAQQIAIQEIDKRQVALLVGMAGRSHWSASVESYPTDRRLNFDVACRVNPSERVSLSSTYQVLSPATAELRSGELHFDVAGAQCVLRPISIGSVELPEISLQSNSFEIRPAQRQDGTTTRWGYELCCLSGRRSSG
jgi:hypothetical protein